MRITSESKDMATLACIKSSSPGRECEDLFDAGDRRWYQSLIGRARHIAENRHDVQHILHNKWKYQATLLLGSLVNMTRQERYFASFSQLRVLFAHQDFSN